LNVTQLTIAGSGFALATASPAPFTLQVNETREILVRFVPTGVGAANGTLTLISNDPVNANLGVALTGAGTAGGNANLPTITAGGVVNAASFRPGLTRGALGTVFGTNMATGTQTVSVVPWPTQMAGAKVLVGGIEAPLYFVSAGQINFQVPFEVPLGNVQVIVSRDGFESAPQTAAITENAPGVFGYARTAQAFDPIVIHLDGTLVTPDKPARAGEFVIAFITGIGGLAQLPQTGNVTGVYPLPTALAPSTVTLGGAAVDALFTGLTPGFIGLGQMNLKLPATLPAGSALPLKIRIGSGEAPEVNLAVAP
jgi:uncharacterized protein (TIGR03437 family)